MFFALRRVNAPEKILMTSVRTYIRYYSMNLRYNSTTTLRSFFNQCKAYYVSNIRNSN